MWLESRRFLLIPINQLSKAVEKRPASEQANTVLISTLHNEHWQNAKDAASYDFIFLDKPIVTTKAEYLEYIVSELPVLGLMNRRYSDYTARVKSFIETSPSQCVLNLNFNVPEKPKDDPIFYSGGRLIGEMCHHIDLAVYLNGSVEDFDCKIIDDYVQLERAQNCFVILTHENGAISKVSYSTNKSPLWEKEAILVGNADKSLAVLDYKRILDDNGRSQSLRETDKGCEAMWRDIKERILNPHNSFEDWAGIDRQVYNILSSILF